MLQTKKMTPAPAVLFSSFLSFCYLCSSNIFLLLYIIASIMITVVPMAAEPMNTARGTGMILTGVPIYFLFIYWKNKPMFVKKLLAVITETSQKLLLVVPKD